MLIINHDNPKYRKKWATLGANKWNGAFYYSKEICKYMIPNIKTDRNWITINVPGEGADHSIVFIHNNLYPEHYDWLKKYKDLILVCGIKETAQKVKHLGKPIVLPLSVDVNYVKQFQVEEKTKKIAYVGRPNKRTAFKFPEGTEFIEGLPRTKLLPELAQFESVFAIGRLALESKILGCKVLPYDPRFPRSARWKVLDSLDAAKILQEKINKIDKVKS